MINRWIAAGQRLGPSPGSRVIRILGKGQAKVGEVGGRGPSGDLRPLTTIIGSFPRTTELGAWNGRAHVRVADHTSMC